MLTQDIEPLSIGVLMPLFFALARLGTTPSAFSGESFGAMMLIRAVAVAGRVLGGAAGARLTGSDTEAMGGDLAYQYGHAGTLAGIGLSPAQTELKAAQFGNQTQTLQPDNVLKQGQITLS